MTTQSEASIAVSGSNVVTAYNDDGRSSPFFKAADDLSGYSWSSNGGGTWHDSELPNPIPGINAGDPVVTADRSGRFFYTTLDFDIKRLGIAVAVGRSDDGGQTFDRPAVVSTHAGITFTSRMFREIDADKPWMAVGPDPANLSHDIVYVGWTEFFFIDRRHHRPQFGSRIVVVRSLDAGQSWSRPATVASLRSSTRSKPHRAQFVNGTSLTVSSAGRLFVGWERFLDRSRDFTFRTRQEWAASSRDAGRSFSAPRLVASPKAVGAVSNLICSNVLSFGAGKLVRVQEFPSLGIGPGGDVYMAYDSGTGSGPVIRVARSSDDGRTWFNKTVTGGGTAFMPALGADAAGVDVTYYEAVGNGRLKLSAARSTDGFVYSTSDVSSVAFGVPITFPPFDPFIAPCYMGDYNGTVRTGGTLYAAWGDNRDVVVNGFWPAGRLDPDVFFAKG